MKNRMSEEDFLPRSLREVTMVWQRGNGQASFNLKIRDGQADLLLSFQLGKPEDHHQLLPIELGLGDRSKNNVTKQGLLPTVPD